MQGPLFPGISAALMDSFQQVQSNPAEQRMLQEMGIQPQPQRKVKFDNSTAKRPRPKGQRKKKRKMQKHSRKNNR